MGAQRHPDHLAKILRHFLAVFYLGEAAREGDDHLSRYDKRDPTPAEMRLVRAGHHVWRLIRAVRAELGDTVAKERPFWCALESIWEAKRQVKAEIKSKSLESLAKWRARAEAL